MHHSLYVELLEMSTSGQVVEGVCTRAMELYPAIKKHEILSFATADMELEDCVR